MKRKKGITELPSLFLTVCREGITDNIVKTFPKELFPRVYIPQQKYNFKLPEKIKYDTVYGNIKRQNKAERNYLKKDAENIFYEDFRLLPVEKFKKKFQLSEGLEDPSVKKINTVTFTEEKQPDLTEEKVEQIKKQKLYQVCKKLCHTLIIAGNHFKYFTIPIKRFYEDKMFIVNKTTMREREDIFESIIDVIKKGDNAYFDLLVKNNPYIVLYYDRVKYYYNIDFSLVKQLYILQQKEINL